MCSAPITILITSMITILLTSVEIVLFRISKLGPVTYLGLQIAQIKIWITQLIVMAVLSSDQYAEAGVMLVQPTEACVVSM